MVFHINTICFLGLGHGHVPRSASVVPSPSPVAYWIPWRNWWRSILGASAWDSTSTTWIRNAWPRRRWMTVMGWRWVFWDVKWRWRFLDFCLDVWVNCEFKILANELFIMFFLLIYIYIWSYMFIIYVIFFIVTLLIQCWPVCRCPFLALISDVWSISIHVTEGLLQTDDRMGLLIWYHPLN